MTYHCKKIYEKMCMLSESIVGSHAEIDEFEVTRRVLASHHVEKLRSKYKGCFVSVHSEELLHISKEVAKVNICHGVMRTYKAYIFSIHELNSKGI